MIPGPIVIVEGSTEASLADEFTLVGDVVEFGAALVGMSQLTKMSANAEEEMATPTAQNADTNLIKPLPFVLFTGPPIYYQSTKVHKIANIGHIGEYTTKLPLCNCHL